MEKLIDPDHLVDYYRSRVRPEDVPVGDFLEASGGLREWRKTACLSDDNAVMGYGRNLFSTVATKPITELDYFSAAVGEHLRAFAIRNYSNLGFGAKFLGYEGLDPDGVRLVAEASLVADRPLLDAYHRSEEQAEEQVTMEARSQRRPRTLERVAYQVRPNAAYMLSMVQGVRAHSVRNLKRFESFHERPDDQEPPAVHHLTGFKGLANKFFQDVRRSVAKVRKEWSSEERSQQERWQATAPDQPGKVEQREGSPVQEELLEDDHHGTD